MMICAALIVLLIILSHVVASLLALDLHVASSDSLVVIKMIPSFDKAQNLSCCDDNDSKQLLWGVFLFFQLNTCGSAMSRGLSRHFQRCDSLDDSETMKSM